MHKHIRHDPEMARFEKHVMGGVKKRYALAETIEPSLRVPEEKTKKKVAPR